MNYKLFWRKLRTLAPSVVLMLTACASSNSPVNVPSLPLPAALLVPCPIPTAVRNNQVDSALLALNTLYGQYGECAAKHWELINAVSRQGEKND